ncbi:nicotinate-nucleotide adenylyltransferase [Roseovarius aestuariivivens]|uniref:nicotinate-nucleotide adenylyltransferase n=1 Tax=Roseovarius aestuariivivens TaxID=1888910 RepID=UPI00108034A3|nr:nicotinate-nucleotide adenylyltransferase [Roseovarius aestuariivivens]
MRYALPLSRPGQVIGLLGGSFDPPHAGHTHISREALRRFGLDAVWWLVSPGNPLKAHGPAPLARRLAACRALIDHPRIHVSDLEAQAGTRYTAQTLARLQTACPDRRFVWLMGADNLAQLDRWQDWREIVARVPMGVLARPGQRISARMSKAARIFRAARIPARHSHLLGRADPPTWCFVNVPMLAQSSSAIRARGDWGGMPSG